MDADRLPRLRSWLARDDVRAVDPERVDALAGSLADGADHVTAGRWGALIGYDPAPGRRRLVQLDRRGNLIAGFRWRADGALAFAKCLTAAGEWIGVEPGAGAGPWGAGDLVWRLGEGAAWAPVEALTAFQSLDYARLELIPALASPRLLPPGAGTAILDLLAGLMKDQGVARTRYRGPYPTEQLFTALLESFRCDPAESDPAERFMDGADLDWLPAPHERHRVAPGVTVQLRHEIDKVVYRGAAFYRRDWQSVIRREPRVVRRDGGRVVCSLWAFDAPLEDRLVLSESGEVLEISSPAVDGPPPSPLPPVWIPALTELIARESAPALGESIGAALRALDLRWGPVDGDLMATGPGAVTLSRALRDAGVARIRAVSPGPERARPAIEFALEVARLLAPTVRLRAQIHLESLSPEAQQRALDSSPTPPTLSPATGKLLTLLTRTQA